MKLIIENQYFSPINFYSFLSKGSHVIFEQYDNYQKMSFRNRCMVAGPNGAISLSIPLQGGRDQKMISRDVKIANRYNWQEQHWRTILSCYNRAPWFEYYGHELEKYYKTNYEFLAEWNLDLFKWMLSKLDLNLEIGFTKTWRETYDQNECIDFRNRILPRNYKNFPCQEYQQVFAEKTGFLSNLSILDILFCKGKNAIKSLEIAP